jgi:hypothetical protein
MKGYYDITTTIKTALLEDNDVKTVTKGSKNQIDNAKKTMFPLSHLKVENTAQEGAVLRFSLSLELLDIVDISNDQTNDRFIHNNNEDDIMNTQLAVGVRLMSRLERGDLLTSDYALDGDPNFEPLHNEYENGLSGWLLTFDVLYKHEMTVC